MKRHLLTILLSVCVFLNPVLSTVYQVGPGKSYSAIGDVPLTTLSAGDEIHVYWKSTPYYEKLLLGGIGTEAQPIIFKGIPNEDGDKPVLDGNGAVTNTDLNYWGEDRGLIKIGGSSVPSISVPEWIVVDGFELRNAHEDHTFSDDSGNTVRYRGNAACVYIEVGQNIVIKNNEIHGCGNGIFAGVYGGETKFVTVESNYIYGNGNSGSIYEHNTYMAVNGITYKYNHYGPLCDGCLGNNLKDRSAGVVIMNNWIESGNRQLDLVDEGGLKDLASYRETHVFGNLLIEDNSGNRQIIHYGGDSGNQNNYRKGTLYLYHNTIISTRTDKFTLVRLSSEGESADIRNNIIHAPDVTQIEIFAEKRGKVEFHYNWVNEGWINSIENTGSGSLTSSNILTGSDPMFTDFTNQDFTLTSGSAGVGSGETLSLKYDAAKEYVKHTSYKTRCSSSGVDMGAYSSVRTCSESTETTESNTITNGNSSTSVDDNQVSVSSEGNNEDSTSILVIPVGLLVLMSL
eukprot:TRINITY_DN1030_c0_g1_i7.p1 TRINITY_DN1030_c0_g1~~TRINITY_DN1030_c0_g1_i7.p1  ORF type:complete len:572 (-),score=159.67 TRINITY_DN1030_c0_g1_i7:108-1649(-)